MLTGINRVFFIGIKGVAMTNLARILKKSGKQVSGSDVVDTFITDSVLSHEHIPVITSFNSSDLPHDVDLVVYAASHGGKENPQVKEAHKRGIQVLHQAELLGLLSPEFATTIAVAGCHGKTTTSALLAHAMKKLKAKVSYMVGVSQFGESYGGEYGGNDYLVLEADEYGIDPPDNKTPKFHLLKPDYALITNIDHDHPDMYPTVADTQKAFLQFMQQVIQQNAHAPQLVLCADDPILHEMMQTLPDGSYYRYGTTARCDVTIADIDTSEQSTTFTISSNIFHIIGAPVSIPLFGEKNVLNTAAVITLLLHIGYSIRDITEAIRDFPGAKRRFELKMVGHDTYLFDDYAHHPQEIEATIAAARRRFPQRKLIVIFQPHTYSRTTQFADGFVKAVAAADDTLLLPVFESAREQKAPTSVTHEELSRRAHEQGNTHVHAFEKNEEVITYLKQHLARGDVIMTMGAGDVYKIAERIVPLIKELG